MQSSILPQLKYSRWFKLLVVALSGGFSAILAISEMHRQERYEALLEIQAAESELELALVSLSVRLSSIASGLEQASQVTPQSFARQYEVASGSSAPRSERAMALMLYFDEADEAQDFISSNIDLYAASSYPPFEISPIDSTDGVFPVILVEPESSREREFGYSILTSPDRTAVAQLALGSGQPRITRPVILSQDDEQNASSFLIFQPVYDAKMSGFAGSRDMVLAASISPPLLLAGSDRASPTHAMDMSLQVRGVELKVLTPASETDRPMGIEILTRADTIDVDAFGTELKTDVKVYWYPSLRQILYAIIAGFVASAFSLTVLSYLRERAVQCERLADALSHKETQLNIAFETRSKAQKLESLGLLVGSVAHDFNNRLMVILGNLEILESKLAGTQATEEIKEALDASIGAAQLTGQLLTVGGDDPD